MGYALRRIAGCAAAILPIAVATVRADDAYPGWRDAALPPGPYGEAVALGQRIVTKTGQAAPAYAGSALNCTSCHLDGGRTRWASPWVGIWGVFPEYRPRNARVNALEDRIGDCFERSLNGRRPPHDSPEMIGILAYMQWLSREVPTGHSVNGRGFARIAGHGSADPVRGERIYAEKCAACHGADGQGMTGTDGAMIYPPLWGDRSFNIGAGMARLETAAAFVKANMPLGQGGTLSDDEAFDVAAFFTRQPRPDFAAKHDDWPKGGKPRDARY